MRFLICLFFLFGLEAYAMTVDKHKITLEKLSDYEFCHQNKYPAAYCQAALDVWLESHAGDMLPAAKLTRKHMHDWVSVPYFHKAQSDKNFQCQDQDLKMAIESAFHLTEDNKKIIDAAKAIAFGPCKESVPKAVVGTLSLDTYGFKSTCQSFIKLGLIKGLKKAKCKKINK